MASRFGQVKAGVTRRRRVLALLTVLAAVMVPAAIALACNPQAYLRLDKAVYAPGESIQVSGAFFKGNRQLTLSLEPGGQVGSVTTSGNGSFTTRITAPRSAGSYTVSAIGHEPDGSVTDGLPAKTSFSVRVAASSPQPGSGAGPGTQPRPAQPGTTPQGAAPQEATPGASPQRPSAQQRGTGRFAEPEVPRTRGFPSPDGAKGGGGGGGGPFGGGPGGGGSGGGASFGGPGGSSGAVTTGDGILTAGGKTVFAGSVSRSDRVAGSPRAAGRGQAPGSTRDSAGGDDVWSGFESGRAPGLLAGDGEAVLDDGAGPQLGWGLGLLALGLLALVSGLTVAEIRRRRAA